MNNKLWLKAVNGEVVVNCNSKKECDDYLYMCNKNEVTIANEVRDNAWKSYKINVCFMISHNDMYFGSSQHFKESNIGIVTYTELMEDKKTFTGPELAQAILDGKFKEGTKFKSDAGFEYKVCPYDTHFDLYDTNGKMATSGVIVWRTFTLIEEPKEFKFFNQVRNSGKKIKVKSWSQFYNLPEALKIISDYDQNVINDVLNKKLWVEE